MKILIVSALLFFFQSIVFAGVPNTFSAGDPVSADKINENFEFASKRMYVKNNGTIFGTIVELSANQTGRAYIVTDKGYFYLKLKDSIPGPPILDSDSSIIYATNDCSGPAYVNDNPGINRIYVANNIVYYIEANTPVTSNVAYGSYYNGTSCSTPYDGGAPTSRYALTPNDEAVTGFPSSVGTLSISFE